MLRRALKDHMLKQVCHPCLAVVFVARADHISDVDGDGRLRLIGEE